MLVIIVFSVDNSFNDVKFLVWLSSVLNKKLAYEIVGPMQFTRKQNFLEVYYFREYFICWDQSGNQKSKLQFVCVDKPMLVFALVHIMFITMMRNGSFWCLVIFALIQRIVQVNAKLRVKLISLKILFIEEPDSIRMMVSFAQMEFPCGFSNLNLSVGINQWPLFICL